VRSWAWALAGAAGVALLVLAATLLPGLLSGPRPARDGADGNHPPSRRRPTPTLSHPRPAAKPV